MKKVMMILAAVIMLALLISQSAADKPAWDVCYDMTNQHIEWTYAGRK